MDRFGASLAMWETDVVVGALLDDHGAYNAGSVALFSFNDVTECIDFLDEVSPPGIFPGDAYVSVGDAVECCYLLTAVPLNFAALLPALHMHVAAFACVAIWSGVTLG